MAQIVDHCGKIGIQRILTSGSAANAVLGAAMIQRMVERSACINGPIIIAGGGIRCDNVHDIVRTTGVVEVHGSLRSMVQCRSTFRREGVTMGRGAQHFVVCM